MVDQAVSVETTLFSVHDHIIKLTSQQQVTSLTHYTNCFLLFCCSATNTQHQSIRQLTRRAVAHRVTGHFTAGLWQCDAGRPFYMSARQTSVCLERCGASDEQIQDIWLSDAAAARPSLVANLGTNHVSAGDIGIPLSEWTCTTVPSWWPSPCGGGRVSATTAALIEWSAHPRRVLRPAIALSMSLPLGRGTAFRSRWRHQRPFRFSGSICRQFYLVAPSRLSNILLRLIVSPCYIQRFYVFSIMCFSL